jgi:hypothetical protein
VRNRFGVLEKQLRGERLRRFADLRDLDRQLALRGLDRARTKPVAQPALVIAQSALILGPTFVASPTEPGVELVLNHALDDQPDPKLRELRQRLAPVIADPHGQQPLDLRLNPRRRRYGTSHGVGPPSIVLQDLREPTPSP